MFVDIVPLVIEMLMIFWIVCASTLMWFLSSFIGIGSTSHDYDAADRINFLVSARVMGLNL